jgi:hypothetical protein
VAVRPEGANHQWRKNPPGELSIDPVADERLVPMSGDGNRRCRMAQATAPILDSTKADQANVAGMSAAWRKET